MVNDLSHLHNTGSGTIRGLKDGWIYRGQRFWAVYIAKPGSKNAKEIRVDATSGRILAVQTERPADQAKEPPKTH
jgi:hypothetical protein